MYQRNKESGRNINAKPSETITEFQQEHDKNYNQANSVQNTEQSTQSLNSIQEKVNETPVHRPRGRPRINRNNNVSTPENGDKTKKKTEQSSQLTLSKKHSTDSNLAIQPKNHKTTPPQTAQNDNLDKDKSHKIHSAKNGNILYKNIHNKTDVNKTASSSNLNNISSSISANGYNYIVTHSRLETIETRINDGEIPEMIHPAQSIVYDRLHQEPLFLNQKESEKRKNYRIIQTLKKIPSCWEPKPWDKEEEKMTNFENLEFTEMIKNLEPCNSKGEIKEWYKSKNVKNGTKQRKKRQPIPFVSSLIDFSTDSFDDQTDFDFYE